MAKEKKEKSNPIDRGLRDGKKRLLNSESTFDVKEAYRELRTNVMFSVPSDGCKVLEVTSSIASEGKSTTNFNLAITFAEMESKVLVIDCDLRRPNVGRLINKSKEKGLSNVLINDAKIDDVIFHTDYENLDVIMAGNIPPNPSELLASDAMRETVEKLKSRYDYIFLDTPPVTMVTDATIVSKLVNGVIIVSRQYVSEKPMLVDAINKLKFAEAKVIGIVLNDVELNTNGYGGYRYKYKYYKRGYYKRGYGGYGYYQ